MTSGFFVPGPLPGLNELIDAKSHRSTRRSRKGKSWDAYAETKRKHSDAIEWYIAQAKVQRFDAAVRLRFTWYEKDLRRDADNIAAGGRKIILDAMVKAGVIEDDSRKYVKGWIDEFSISKEHPGVMVQIMRDE